MAYFAFRQPEKEWEQVPRFFPRTLSDKVKATFTRHSPWFNDFIFPASPPPADTLTLAQWSQPAELSILLARYATHCYRDEPERKQENKPLLSLWAQWYTGLLVPPLMLAQLTMPQPIDLSPERVSVRFHETGRAEKFWLDVQPTHNDAPQDAIARIEDLIETAITPVVSTLESTGHINGKLIWSNLGYIVNWFLNQMSQFHPLGELAELHQHCFLSPQLRSGRANPLFRTMLEREKQWVRRTCCQRNRLPGVQQCGDCTLK
ncbi:siderophore-iron reductase FhuF [Mangrovibacter yixingensis]|uniref:siderophore-iron reductase FhuF n=1 Tax=Mangrovibacter yixingensis TaxID=1529639 RepID=UPI001CFDF4D1|nr:siderophore-iron reductase FhuF [Mangrovibacter yixingensis]